jgi:hypothetical protein
MSAGNGVARVATIAAALGVLGFVAGPAIAALADGQLGGPPTTTAASTVCPDGSAVTGAQGLIGSIGVNPIAGTITVTCTDGAIALGSMGTSSSGGSGATNCAAGEVAVGITGREGDFIDQLSVRCRPANLGGTTTTATGYGGSGGSADGPYDCPAGKVLTGLTGSTTDDTVYVRHVVIQCAVPVTPDTTPPTVSLAAAGHPTQLTKSFTVRWTGSDDTGVTSFDVRDRKAAWNTSFGSRTTWKSGVTTTSATFTGSPGHEYCFSVRARDEAGNISGWSHERCAALPLDDRALARSSGWSSINGSAFYNATATQTARKGKTLTRTGATGGRAALVVDTGKDYGTVKVLYDGVIVKTKVLDTSTTRTRVVVPLPDLKKRTKIVIRTTKSKRVRIDGLLLARI